MNNQKLPVKFAESVEFTIPEFGSRPDISLQFAKTSEGEKRLVEAQAVNGGTYSELEYVFNEGYREAKVNLTTIRYELMQAEKIVRQVKAEHLLDEYPTFLKENGLKDNAAMREAFLEKQEDFEAAMDRVAMMKALESLVEGKIKVFENVCRYMKKEMDIQIRSGIDPNKYIR